MWLDLMTFVRSKSNQTAQLFHLHKNHRQCNEPPLGLRARILRVTDIDYDIQPQRCASRVASSPISPPSLALPKQFHTELSNNLSRSSPSLLAVETLAHRCSHPSRNFRVSSTYLIVWASQEYTIHSRVPVAAMNFLTSNSWTHGIQVL